MLFKTNNQGQRRKSRICQIWNWKFKKNKFCVLCGFSCVQLFVTLWIIAHQTPLFIGFSRQEYWSRLPCSPPGDLSDPGMESTFLISCIGRQVLYHQHHLGSPRRITATVTAKSLQLCLTLCDPIDGSLPGSPVSGILQARTLEWVAISFSNA